jgi:hypothetical protein
MCRQGDQGQPRASADGLQNRAAAQPRDFFGTGHCIPRRSRSWSTDAMTVVWLK